MSRLQPRGGELRRQGKVTLGTGRGSEFQVAGGGSSEERACCCEVQQDEVAPWRVRTERAVGARLTERLHGFGAHRREGSRMRARLGGAWMSLKGSDGPAVLTCTLLCSLLCSLLTCTLLTSVCLPLEPRAHQAGLDGGALAGTA